MLYWFMGFINRFWRFFAKNFVFLVGFLFIFVFGFIYAYLRPQGVLINVIFFVIMLGWMIFIIKYFWELMEKDK
jgi:hypothetical protein